MPELVMKSMKYLWYITNLEHEACVIVLVWLRLKIIRLKLK